MFDILLPGRDDRPLYEQLYVQIRDKIKSGAIVDGTRLPSVRALQLQLNISKTPIETAYQMLAAEGYAVSRPRSGLYVSNPYEHAANGMPEEHARTVGLPATVRSDKLEPSLSSGTGVIDFDPTALDGGAFPLRAWSKAMKEALERRQDEIGAYGNPLGEPGLRAVVADYLRHSRGVRCSPDQIVVGSGIANSIGILTKLLPGVRLAAVEEPGYNLVRDQLLLNGCDVLPIPVGGKGISLKELEASTAQIVYVTPSHQFPTGAVMPYPEREQLLKWAAARKAFVIEDDYDGEFRYLGKPIPSLQGMDARGAVIYIGTFSKALTPALRLNYMVLPPELIERLAEMPCEVAFAPSRLEQWAMESFIAQGHWYRHIRKARSLYRKKHRHLIALIKAHMGSRVEIAGQNAGLHIQLLVKKRLPSEQLIEAAAKAGVKVYDLRKMWMSVERRSSEYPVLYLGFAGLGMKEMESGIRLLRHAWFG